MSKIHRQVIASKLFKKLTQVIMSNQTVYKLWLKHQPVYLEHRYVLLTNIVINSSCVCC